jgi:hypothetical protein
MTNPIAEWLNRLQDRILKRDKELAARLNQVVRQQMLSAQISALEQQKQILAHLYQTAHGFTNLVIVAGYAGIFAVWQFVRDIIEKEAMIWTAVLITTSILLFAIYETYKMIAQAFFFQRLNRIIFSDLAEEHRIKVWQQAFTERISEQSRIWLYFLLPIVITGYGAAGILLFTFLRMMAKQ